MTQTPIEYEALNFEGMARRANYRVISFREDILIALDRKDAAAMLFNVIYRWMERKRDEVLAENARRLKQGIAPLTTEEVEERMWIYMSYNDFARETGGACSYNTVIAMLKYLVNTKKVLDRRKNHDPHFADYEYCINREAVIKLLNALPAHPKTYTKIGTPKQKSDTSTNSGTPSTNFGISATNSGIETTKDGRGVYQSWGTSQESTHITTSNTQNYNTGDNVVPAIADHNASPQYICYPFKQHPFIGVDDEDHPTVMIVTLTPAFPHPHFSEMEDKRRERIAAWEVLPAYKKKGLEVEVRWEHETERQTVDATTTIVESTAAVGENTPTQEPQFPQSSVSPENQVAQFLDNAIPEPPCSVTDGLTQESAVVAHSENAPSESPLQTQEMPPTTQAVESSSNQASKEGASNDRSLSTQHHGPVMDSGSGVVPVVEEAKRQVQPVKQANDVHPIAVVTTKQPQPETSVQPAPQKPRGSKGKNAAQPEQGQLIVLAPEMPPAIAKWNEETAVQIIEAKKGRRYSDTTRSQEKSEAKKILAMYYDGSLITRELFENAWDKMASWSWWSERNIKPMIKHLRKDDKIIAILDELQPKSKPTLRTNGNIRQFPTAGQQLQQKSSIPAGFFTEGVLAGQPDYRADPWT